MGKIIKIIIINLMVLLTIFSSVSPVIAVNFSEGDTVRLEKDHECISLLKIKGKNMMKGVTYIVYKNPQTGEKQPAFCVEPEKNGIGTGAGDGYDVTINSLEDERLWRILYKGFMGSNYRDWNLECEDDLYYATKTAVHSLVQGISPKDKYEEPTRVGYGEDISFEDVLRRGRAVLEVSQKLYEYGINETECYKKPQINIVELSEVTSQIDGRNYLIKDFKLQGNRDISAYKVIIEDFPKGTLILNGDLQVTDSMSKDIFKIAVPTENIRENVNATIKIENAQVKTYPVFYANAYDENVQDYITYFSNYEEIGASVKTSIDAYKSSIILNKIDSESKINIPGVKFQLFNYDDEEIGTYITNEEGKIIIENLKPGKYYLREKEVPNDYCELLNSVELELKWDDKRDIIVENTKADIRVNIEKRGKIETKCGDIIEYNFENIENNSNVVLDSFTWTDYIPTNAVRVKILYTGTWNEEGEYSIWYKTNKNDYRILKEGLSTAENNKINFEETELEDEEYITEYQLRFKNTKIGFKEIEFPKLYCKVQENLENGFVFENKTDIVGRYKTNISIDESNWKTLVYTPKGPEQILPRTGE